MNKMSTIDDLSEQVQAANADVEKHGRRLVESYWRLGRLLHLAKRQIAHGDFMAWYEARGISKNRASRAGKVFEAYPQISRIGKFGTLEAALDGAPKRLTAEDKAELEIDTLKQEISALENQRDELAERNRDLDARLPSLYEAACAVSGKDEVDRNLAKLDGLQGKLRASEAARLEDAKALAILKEEAGNLRRLNRKIEQEISTMQP